MAARNIMVWGEIPVTDMEKAVAFYNEVFGYEMTIDNSGPNPMAMLGGVMETAGAHLYPGTPAKDGGNTIHIDLPDTLEAGIERCKAAGGEVVSPPISIPSGRFVYAKDLDGNSIGLYESTE
ncbi:VOC family protein [Cognatiyoonia sp. IB215446]|uniref:VOC family protein n=1 Tax=Cognatiyoonia sp. IB215446 TaxID=3097355 RepID=UPI002A0C5B9F|nr:VOC family protein [Cognatiyoonia sp. IB215446]MDX8347171.1 VOC family protein [Cognatiyoonia sp. IB215446]